MKHYMLGCDWGTSAFRLRLINAENQTLIGEITSPEGVASTFTAWQTEGKPTGITRSQFFRHLLKRRIHRLAEQLAIDLAGVSIVISGMASSSIGLDEVPYASLPFPTDGSQAGVKRLPAQPDFPNDIFLIGGICTQHDVMRGEETQLIGLLTLLENQQMAVDESILIFPGTHSKHIYVKNQQVIDFQTYMTGELFNLMAHQSILTDSVEPLEPHPLSDDECNAFKSGIRDARAHELLNSLFRVRTNQLFDSLTKRQNALYLSGLLIGSELKTLVDQPPWKLVLCSDSSLYDLYTVALQALNLSERATPVSINLLGEATIAGQVKIMQNQLILISK